MGRAMEREKKVCEKKVKVGGVNYAGALRSIVVRESVAAFASISVDDVAADEVHVCRM